MKNTGLILIAAFAFILLAFHSPKEDIKVSGNGHVITTTRSVDPFNELSVEGVFNIYISQGNIEMVQVETDENLQDFVWVENKNKELQIRTKDDVNINKSNKNNIYITIKDISKLEINSVGKTECKEELKLKNLSLEVNSVGKTIIRLDCNQLNAEINAVGSLIIEGKAKSANIEHTGIGSMDAYDFYVDYLSLEHSGIGSVKANALKEISIDSEGIGSVHYKGPAEVNRINSSGIGSVKKVH